MNRLFRKTASLVTALALILPAASCRRIGANADTAEESIGTPQTQASETVETTGPSESSSEGTGTADTGSLSERGNGYEGIKGTGKYNYGEALQKSVLFYELQR